MADIIGIVIVTFIVAIVGGGGAYFIWVKTRPKKITWKAKVYQVGEGIKPPIKDNQGTVLANYRLSDLRPYTKDVIEKIEKDPGITIHRLQKLNRVVPAVTSDVVDYWGEKQKEVAVVMSGDSFTLLKKGYDRKGNMIFNPMPHDRINMIQSQMVIRKERLRKEKDILQAITPWVVAGICMLGLVAIALLMVDGFLELNENSNAAQITASKNALEASKIMASAISGKIQVDETIKEEEPPPVVD